MSLIIEISRPLIHPGDKYLQKLDTITNLPKQQNISRLGSSSDRTSAKTGEIGVRNEDYVDVHGSNEPKLVCVADGHGCSHLIKDRWTVGGYESAKIACEEVAKTLSKDLLYFPRMTSHQQRDTLISAFQKTHTMLLAKWAEGLKNVNNHNNISDSSLDQLLNYRSNKYDGSYWTWLLNNKSIGATLSLHPEPITYALQKTLTPVPGYVMNDGSVQPADFGTTLTTSVLWTAGPSAFICTANAGDSDVALFRSQQPISTDTKKATSFRDLNRTMLSTPKLFQSGGDMLNYAENQENTNKLPPYVFTQWLTADHNTTNSQEVIRMKSHGSNIVEQNKYFTLRRWDDSQFSLMVSRGLGHPSLQTDTGIIPDPDVTLVQLQLGDVVVIGTDGLWNTPVLLPNKQVIFNNPTAVAKMLEAIISGCIVKTWDSQMVKFDVNVASRNILEWVRKMHNDYKFPMDNTSFVVVYVSNKNRY